VRSWTAHIYQVHWPDPLTPIEGNRGGDAHTLQRGKIRANGVGNFSIDQMERFRRFAPIHELFGWSLDVSIKAEIDRILSELIKFPVGPEFMAPSARS
jgi:aryl-alcohol dehydrogenase-like predicted oxidoreductase